MKRVLSVILSLSCLVITSFSQPVPTVEENIPYLVTFGGNAVKSWGDDDFSQVFFFVIPFEHKNPVYFRVYDPDTGGDLDELKSTFDTKTKYIVYGGKECYSHNDAKNIDPVGNYKSGTLLASKMFGVSDKYNKNWYTFGPFNPSEGEMVEKFGGYIFKVVAEGITGDDGNLYRYYMSTSSTENKAIEGGNAFTYEYSFRLWDNPSNLSHIYPYIDDEVVYVKQSNFDWDNDGYIRIISVSKNGIKCAVSGDNNYESSTHKITEAEKNTSFDFQFVKSKSPVIKNNNVVVSIENQDGEMMPFFASPIGGVPKYNYKIGVKKR